MNENILRDSTFNKEKEYWLDNLSGEIVRSYFPYDFLGRSTNDPAFEPIPFRMPQEITAAFMKMSNDSDIKLHMLLLASVDALLYKYTGNEDLIVGTPIYRQSIQGDFINTVLAIRNQVNKNTTFKELVIEVRKTLMNAAEHQNYPLEKLLYLLNIPAVDHGFPLFDTMVLLDNLQDPDYIKPVSCNTIFKFSRKEQSIDGVLEYNAQLYQKSTMERMIERFMNLLHKIGANVDEPLSNIDLLTAEERTKILKDFNQTTVKYHDDQTIGELFEEQAARYPNKMAVSFTYLKDPQQDLKPGNLIALSLTYAELNQQANQLAGLLIEKGIKPDDLIGILVERSLEMVIGVLGVLKAGAAYLPLDPEYPEARLKYMIEDSQIKLILTQSQLVSKIKWDKDFIVIDGNQDLSRRASSNLARRNTPENLAYTIYTSGSTGQPKGVAIEHKGIASLKTFFETSLGVSEHERVVQFAPFSFDASIWEMFMSLLTGATLFLAAKDIINDSIKFEDFLNRNQITIATLPPPYLASLNPERVNSLKKVVAAGSATTTELLNNWSDQVEYFNAYGPTETTICATVWKAGKERVKDSLIPIGGPISNTQVYIVDRNLKLQPIGLAGEICVSGVGLARNYLNRPDLTTEKFVANPFAPGTKMYRTGDLGRWRSDGYLDFLGRIDNQLKVRGNRVEIGEIEFQLLQYPKLKEVIVTGIPDEIGDMALAAYYVAEDELSAHELKEYLSQNLPGYMIPSFFVQLDQLPLTPNGKVDRKALPKPQKNIKLSNSSVEPQKEVEVKMANIWQGLLGVDKIGMNDNFFELGGDSLKATLLVGKVYKELDMEISLMDIFKDPSLKEMISNLKPVGDSDRELQEIEKTLDEIDELPEDSVSEGAGS